MMKIHELIERLSHLPQNAIVCAFDADECEFVEVSGVLFDEVQMRAELQTDEV